MNIYEKLQAARVELQKMKLKKSGKNKFAGFDYFELSDIIPAINQIFNEKKMFSQFSISDNLATLTIIDAEKSDDFVLFTSPIAELELKGCNAIQALGGVHTYLRRYLYMNALEIVEADLFDAISFDGISGKEEKKPQKPAQKPEVKNADKIIFGETESDPDIDIISGLAGVADIKNLEIYYNQNKDKVKDLDAFIEACKRRKGAINGK